MTSVDSPEIVCPECLRGWSIRQRRLLEHDTLYVCKAGHHWTVDDMAAYVNSPYLPPATLEAWAACNCATCPDCAPMYPCNCQVPSVVDRAVDEVDKSTENGYGGLLQWAIDRGFRLGGDPGADTTRNDARRDKGDVGAESTCPTCGRPPSTRDRVRGSDVWSLFCRAGHMWRLNADGSLRAAGISTPTLATSW